MNSTFDTFANNKLSFVTFNYDRTVEHFFFSALSNTYNREEADVRAVLQHIPVVHLHGRLGALPWQGGPSRPFGTNVTRESLRVAADSIKIIHEDVTDGRDQDFAQAKKLLTEAEQIFLVGFGYNATNVERLGIANLPDHKMIGTSIGLGPKSKLAAKTVTGAKVQLMDCSCTHIVQEVMRWS